MGIRPPSGDDGPRFENTYPYSRHEFSELVRIGILIGAWVCRLGRARIVVEPPAEVKPRGEIGPGAPAT